MVYHNHPKRRVKHIKRIEAADFSKSFRADNKLSQKEFGEITGLIPVEISMIENINPKVPLTALTTMLKFKKEIL